MKGYYGDCSMSVKKNVDEGEDDQIELSAEEAAAILQPEKEEIGRASCRERV